MIPNTRSLDFDLGETADMIRDTVSSFAQSEIAPRAAEIDRTDEFPRDLWPRMGELGLLGVEARLLVNSRCPGVSDEHGSTSWGSMTSLR